MLRYLSLLFFLVFYSCSGTSLKNLFGTKEDSKQRNEKLLKDFELEKEVMEKFAVKKEVSPTSEEKKTSTAKKKPSPKKLPKKSKKRTAKKKKESPKQEIIESNKQEMVEAVGHKYPADFPEDLKDLDYESEKYWSKYEPFLIRGERAIFAIKYGIISTGNITIETMADTVIGDQETYHFQARLKTSDYYSYLYELDDLIDSYVRKTDFLPLKFSLIQRESSQDVDDLQLFDLESLQNYSFYKRVTKEKTKKEKNIKTIPRFFQDPLSIMYFVRGLPMVEGATYSIPFANKGKIEMLEAGVAGIESVSTKIGTHQAYKVIMHTEHEGKTLKGGDMTFWFKKDETRIFLKFQAKIKIGSISGDILEYTRPNE